MFLTELKRKEKEELLQADSKQPHLTPDRDNAGRGFQKKGNLSEEERKRRYRDHQDDTPSHGGGVNVSAKSAIDDRHHKSRRIDYRSSKDGNRNRDDRYGVREDDRRRRSREDERYRDRERDGRDYGRDRDRQNRGRDSWDDRRKNDHSSRSNRSGGGRSNREEERRHTSRREDSVRFRDEPMTPAFSVASTPGRKAWDDDDSGFHSKRSGSQWDFPTPGIDGRSKRDDETPLPTPVHKFNPWVRQPGSSHVMQTPSFVKNKGGDETGGDLKIDKEEWEDEQKRLDREWYNMDEGYDDIHNPFAGISDEYTKKKEEQLAQKKHQRMSAQQRQINRDNELWEKNRLLTSGVVMNVDGSEDYDEDNEARVHLLVHNIVPPFLDGRIVFTKQFEPVVPVKVSILLTFII